MGIGRSDRQLAPRIAVAVAECSGVSSWDTDLVNQIAAEEEGY